jgi:hypothetical protein
MESLYRSDGTRFVSSELTRGPWSPLHQHGGPVAALLANQIERRVADEALQPARFTVEFLRPIPIAPIEVTTEIVRPGKKARGVSALASIGGEPVARAHALFVRRQSLAQVATPTLPAPIALAEAQPYQFGFFLEKVGYHTAVELRLARGTWGSGAMLVWMRLRVPVVDDAPPSPLERVLTAADSGNGVSAAVDATRYTFVNPDLTVYLQRPLDGEWLCLDARTTVSESGALADCALYDPRGALGRSLQSLIVEPR